MQHINKHGLITFGRHKGKRPNQVPSEWLDWAKANIDGFSESLEALDRLVGNHMRKPTGRTYILKNKFLQKSHE